MQINKIIKVGVIFKEASIIPRWFMWENRKYEIKSIDYTWTDNQGQEKLINFSVNDGTNTFQLTYNTARLSWQLSCILT